MKVLRECITLAARTVVERNPGVVEAVDDMQGVRARDDAMRA